LEAYLQESGVLVTAEIPTSASGNFMPTMFVFPRARENEELPDDAPQVAQRSIIPVAGCKRKYFLSGSTVLLNFQSQQQENLYFCFWMDTKVRQKIMKLTELARKSHVVLLSFPLHTTRRLQPLNVSFMAPLNQYYSDGTRK
jgi:hypothetical protein